MDAERIDALVIEAETLATPVIDPAAPAPEPEEAVVVRDEVGEAEGVFALVVAVASAVEPTVETLYDAARVRKIAEAYVPLAQKRGWDLVTWLENWGPEIAFVIAVVPPQIAKAIVAAIKAKFASQKPAPAAEPAKTENGTLAGQGEFKQPEAAAVVDNGGALAPS